MTSDQIIREFMIRFGGSNKSTDIQWMDFDDLMTIIKRKIEAEEGQGAHWDYIGNWMKSPTMGRSAIGSRATTRGSV